MIALVGAERSIKNVVRQPEDLMSPFKRLCLMMALVSMWSPSFLFIKLAVQDIPPLTLSSCRVTIAALFLTLILYARGGAFPRNLTFWLRTAVMAFFASVLPFYLFCYSEQTIDSSLASIINGTTPMFTAVLAQLFVASDRMTPQKVVGVICSCGGVFLLFAGQILEGVSGTLLGLSAAVTAAFCYSVSHVYGKLFTTGLKPFLAPAAQLLVSSLMLCPVALYFERGWELSIPSWSAIGGLMGLSIWGTVCAFAVYYKLLENSGPTAISTVACFFPVIGMFLGFFFLGESMTPEGMVGAALVLSGMILVGEIVKLKFLQPKIPVLSEAQASPTEGS